MTPDDFFDASAHLDAQIQRVEAALEHVRPGSIDERILADRLVILNNRYRRLLADRVEDDPTHPLAPIMSEMAGEIRATIVTSPSGLPSRPAPQAPCTSAPRAREHRERRHVARSTSSADPGGDDPPGPWPARGLAVCPCCGNETAVRPRCKLCGGFGYVGREMRNRWKRGER